MSNVFIGILFALILLYYVMFISMPFLFPFNKTYNHKRVITTRILVFISALCSYGIAIYALVSVWNILGLFSLLFLFLMNWILLPLYIIAILVAFANHSFILLIITIIATPTIKYYLKSLEIKEILRGKNVD